MDTHAARARSNRFGEGPQPGPRSDSGEDGWPAARTSAPPLHAISAGGGPPSVPPGLGEIVTPLPGRRPGSPEWEVILLRRRPGARRRSRVAGRLHFAAGDAATARTVAAALLEERASGDPDFGLGVLRPLTRRAPGTRRFVVTFAEWREGDEAYARVEVQHVAVWAADATDARRIAVATARRLPGYRPQWRVTRVDPRVRAAA